MKGKLKRFSVLIISLLLLYFAATWILPSSVVDSFRRVMEDEVGLAFYFALLFALIIEYVDSLIKESNKKQARSTLIEFLRNEIDDLKSDVGRILTAIKKKEDSVSTNEVASHRSLVLEMMSELLEKIDKCIHRFQTEALQSEISLEDIDEYKILLNIREKVTTGSATNDISIIKAILTEVNNL